MLIDDLPTTKRYPALVSTSTLFSIIGWLLFSFGIVLSLVLIALAISLYYSNPEEILFIGSTVAIYGISWIGVPTLIMVGVFFIVIAEIIHLLIDLQYNLDRQSLTQTLILNRLIEKGNHESTNRKATG